jgi:hypothetical protein
MREKKERKKERKRERIGSVEKKQANNMFRFTLPEGHRGVSAASADITSAGGPTARNARPSNVRHR